MHLLFISPAVGQDYRVFKWFTTVRVSMRADVFFLKQREVITPDFCTDCTHIKSKQVFMYFDKYLNVSR